MDKRQEDCIPLNAQQVLRWLLNNLNVCEANTCVGCKDTIQELRYLAKRALKQETGEVE